MGTISEKLTYLDNTKTAIKEAIKNKGVDVKDDDTFRSYAEKIESIEVGTGIVDSIDNQNTAEGATTPLKIWQGTETEWNEQNISSHEDYLSFIEDVGVKIGDIDIAAKGGNIMSEDLTVTPSIEDATVEEAQYDEYTSPFTDSAGDTFDGVSKVKVRKIGSWIDSHLSADNIRKDVSVLGVKGNIIELVPETITVSANTQLQTITPTTGNGFTEVKVNAITLQDKTVTPTNSQQTVRYDSNYTGLGTVTVKAVDATADSNIKAENIKEDVTILGVTGTFAGKKIDSYKTVTPTTSYQTIRPDEGFDGISYVNVNPVTYNIDSNIKAANIKKDVNILGIKGTYEGVERVYKTLNVSPKITSQTLTPGEGVDGFNKVEVSAVTSAIDSNILPKNIKRGINILGVEGNYIPENLQSKVVNPTTAVQNVTYDDGYEGLNNVQVNAVTSAIDSNIKAENIRQDVSILGVTGTLEEGIKQAEVEPLKNVAPTKEPIVVKPDEGYKALSQVNIEGVSASIDPNILAENIKKGIEILGVTGNLESQEKIIQNKKEVEPSMIQQVVTPDVGYDALLQVIVKAVTASIDPNILPKNIKKNISILGVTGTLEEGAEQKWFDFSGISGVGTMNKNIDNGGTIASILKIIENNWELKKLFTDLTPDGKIPSNINAALFDLVYGYDNLSSTDNGLEQLFIFFTGGQLYTDYSKLTRIEDQIRWLYPYTNDYGVNGCLINYTDDGTEKVLKLYVLTDSTNTKQPVPVLVDGTMSASLLPEGFDGFRYVVDMTIPAHTVFDPKVTSDKKLNWVLQARKGVKSLIHVNENQPLTIDVSAYDKNFGEEDNGETFNIFDNLNGSGDYTYNENEKSIQPTSSSVQYSQFEKKDKYVYYFCFTQNSLSGQNSGYYNIAWCNNLIKVYVYFDGGAGYYPAWSYNDNDNVTNTTSYGLSLTGKNYYRVTVSNTNSVKIELSFNKTTWYTLLNSTISSYNSSTTNPIYISKNAKFYPDECYVEDADGQKVFSLTKYKQGKFTSHTIYPLTKDLLFYERNNGLGNLVNYVDNGDAVDIKLYHMISDGSISADLSYPFEFDSTIDTSKLIDGSNFIINSNLNAITNGPKSYHVANGSSYGYFKIHTPNESTTFSVTAYVSSEGNYDLGGCYVGTQIYNADRSAITSSTTDGHGKWVFMKGNSSQGTYTTTLDANTDYYIQFYYTKDSSGDSGEDRIVIKNIKFSYFGKSDLYIFAPDENLGSEYQNAEYVDTISIPEHNIYVNEDNQWYQAKHITIDVDNADTTIYTEIEDKE